MTDGWTCLKAREVLSPREGAQSVGREGDSHGRLEEDHRPRVAGFGLHGARRDDPAVAMGGAQRRHGYHDGEHRCGRPDGAAGVRAGAGRAQRARGGRQRRCRIVADGLPVRARLRRRAAAMAPRARRHRGGVLRRRVLAGKEGAGANPALISALPDRRRHAQDRQCHGLRARHQGVDLQVFLGRVGVGADRAHAAQRRAADAGREARVGAATGELALDVQAGIGGGRLVAVEQLVRLRRRRHGQELAVDRRAWRRCRAPWRCR